MDMEQKNDRPGHEETNEEVQGRGKIQKIEIGQQHSSVLQNSYLFSLPNTQTRFH